MDKNSTFKWIDIINPIVESYNNTFHSSIQMTPHQATNTNNATIYYNLYFKNGQEKYKTYSFKYDIDDKVKISFLRTSFQREYDQRWSSEIFSIITRDCKQGLNSYEIKAWNNDPIKGRFLEKELQKVEINNSTLYEIEKVLRTRVRKGKKEVLVKWQSYSNDYNSWISESELVNI
jgi:hypothetical protein